MNKDIINPSKKTITYAATLSSVVSLLPVEEPDVPYLNRSNGIVSITTTPRKGQWAYGKIPRLFLLYAQTLIKEVSPMVDFENRTIHLDETFNSFCKNTGIAANGQREQVTRMLENLGSTVFQVTNWFKDEQGRTVHDAINVLVADCTHICFDRNSDEYKEGSYIRFRTYVGNPQRESRSFKPRDSDESREIIQSVGHLPVARPQNILHF